MGEGTGKHMTEGWKIIDIVWVIINFLDEQGHVRPDMEKLLRESGVIK